MSWPVSSTLIDPAVRRLRRELLVAVRPGRHRHLGVAARESRRAAGRAPGARRRAGLRRAARACRAARSPPRRTRPRGGARCSGSGRWGSRSGTGAPRQCRRLVRLLRRQRGEQGGSRAGVHGSMNTTPATRSGTRSARPIAGREPREWATTTSGSFRSAASSSATSSVDLVLRGATVLRRHLAAPDPCPVVRAQVVAVGSEVGGHQVPVRHGRALPGDEEDGRLAGDRLTPAAQVQVVRPPMSMSSSVSTTTSADVGGGGVGLLRLRRRTGLSSLSLSAHPLVRSAAVAAIETARRARGVMAPRCSCRDRRALRCQHVIATTCRPRANLRATPYSAQRTSLPFGPARSPRSCGAKGSAAA